MKKFRVGFLFALALLVSVFPSFASAQEPQDIAKTCDYMTLKHKKTVKDGKELISIDNPEEFVTKMGIKKNGKKPVAVYIQNSVPEQSRTQTENVSPDATYYVEPLKSYKTCGVDIIASTSGYGTSGQLTLSVADSVSAQWSANVGVSAEIVSAGVGYNVTKTYTVTATRTVNTSGNYYTIDGYTSYYSTDFEVWKDGWLSDSKVGSGRADKPVGVCFVVYEG